MLFTELNITVDKARDIVTKELRTCNTNRLKELVDIVMEPRGFNLLVINPDDIFVEIEDDEL